MTEHISLRHLTALLLGVYIAGGLLAPSCADGPDPKVQKYGTRIHYWQATHEPLELENWESIPEPARSRIINHLNERLGHEFYSKLTLVGGQIYDLARLREEVTYLKDAADRDVAVYILHLRFSLPEAGIEFYDADMQCSADGSVVEEIDLPEIAKDPARSRFIPVAIASETAANHGFDMSRTNLKIRYVPGDDIIVYVFEVRNRRVGDIWFVDCIDINAHDGSVLRIYERRLQL